MRVFVILQLDGKVHKPPNVPDSIKDYIKLNSHYPTYLRQTKQQTGNWYDRQYWAAKFKFKNGAAALAFSLKFNDYLVKTYEN